MNLSYVKNYLMAKKDGITSEDIQILIDEINAYLGVENNLSDISKIMSVINGYNIEYLKCMEDYNSIPVGNKYLLRKIDKAREILCILSALHTYILLSLANISESTYDLQGMRKYLKNLFEKKEHYKSEKIAWVTILKSLSQEANFLVEIKKLNIEKEVGFLKEGRYNGKEV